MAEALNRFDLGYLHLVEPRVTGGGKPGSYEGEPITKQLRKIFKGPIISAGGYNRESANAAIAAGETDLVAFGRLALANPDLVERFAANAPLNPYDRSTFYGGDERGYTDYPALRETENA